MSIDYSITPTHPRNYERPPFFQRLPFMTKVTASYLRTLAHPVHGWARIRAASVLEDFHHLDAGRLDPEEGPQVISAIEDLEKQGYLTRCRVLDEHFSDFLLADGRNVPLSHWVEDPEGPFLVITDWIPSEHAFNATETQAWHQLRQERASWALAAGHNEPPASAD